MSPTLQICLWFDHQAEEAARFYTDIFEDGAIGHVVRYTEAGREHHGREPGSAMTVEFSVNGMQFTALNGGPAYRFTPAVSIQVLCDTQAEIDRYWSRLGEGGDPALQQCGWVTDRYGLSWQIVPRMLVDRLKEGKCAGAERMMGALMQMRKLDIAALQKAYDGA